MKKHFFSRRRFVNTLIVMGSGLLTLPESIASTISRSSDKPNWPSKVDWNALNERVGNRLTRTQLPWVNATNRIFQLLKNPFWNEEQPGSLQSTGWFNAWTAVASPYAVRARNTKDIVEAINFARQHKIKIVVKGTGHDYLGRNCAPDSLLVWTHEMRNINVHDAFVPAGAPEGTKPVHAMTLEAGTRWLEAYQAATKAGRYVQGGGCTSVGACGGFTFGSGFGSFSKMFGTGSGGILEAEVVTADGQVRLVNEYQEPDLYFAIRGGGGGTFGIVSRVTLLSHPIPKLMGLVRGEIRASSDAAYRELITHFLEFYPKALDNPHWGESVHFDSSNTLGFNLLSIDKDLAETKATINIFLEELEKRSEEFTIDLQYLVTNFENLWDCDYWEKQDPDLTTRDPRQGVPANQFWWKSNQSEVSTYWDAYQSWWIPTEALLNNRTQLADAFFQASRMSGFVFQINKGLSGEHPEARSRDEQTALHPHCLNAAALVIMGHSQQYKYVGVDGMEPSKETAAQQSDAINKAMSMITKVTPGAGSYANESNFFLDNWQQLLWGAHYPRLLSIKRTYDPDNFFKVHHCIGSEEL
jgi:FAD/FMN-containing dehydrogenase